MGQHGVSLRTIVSTGFPCKAHHSEIPNLKFNSSTDGSRNSLLQVGRNVFKKQAVQVVSSDVSSPSMKFDMLDAYDDDYDGVVINPECLPPSANAFASMLCASLSNWRLKGKKGVWLKILEEQADLVPIAIKEGFSYHHAEPGYVMLTHWIPNEPRMLPASPSHLIGVGGFVMNEKKEVLVVKEKKCPCRCSGIWKLPTGFINKSEEIFAGAIREVKEETGIDTTFLEMIAFRHAHLLAFEKSDLLFMCMLKPLSSEISIDDKEIEEAKWMPLDEFVGQSFYQDDQMSKKIIDICIATYENQYSGLTAHEMTSKLDGKLSYLYFNNLKKI
ncbi:nudix hydrolase 8-like isoform X2 [Telopea speciosissima]|uniref:nudix hydrolase 8-like isoform X2 n=1 Tax=Telopea speciosissima TaxID=54955 RepID=UPI001CC44B45|nr:nudix hydrolase 8-like isoform X2 [Telopea speciosissima]